MSPTSSTPPLSESAQIEQLRKQLQWAELKIRVLEERLRLELIAKYGPASEKLSDAQLELLQLEPGVSNVEVQAEGEREAEPASTNKSQQRNTPAGRNCPQIYRARKKSSLAHRNSAPVVLVDRKR